MTLPAVKHSELIKSDVTEVVSEFICALAEEMTTSEECVNVKL